MANPAITISTVNDDLRLDRWSWSFTYNGHTVSSGSGASASPATFPNAIGAATNAVEEFNRYVASKYSQ